MEFYILITMSFVFFVGKADRDLGNVPGIITNLTVLNSTSNSITLWWTEPGRNGFEILGYHIEYGICTFYVQNNTCFASSWSYKSSTAHSVNMTFVISELAPITNYSILVRPFSNKGAEYPSASIFYMTDIAAPAAPDIKNLTCEDDSHMGIQVEQPKSYKISTYTIFITNSRGEKFETERERILSEEIIDLLIYLENLKYGEFYTVAIRAGVQSIHHPKTIYYGPFSEERTLQIGSPCVFLEVIPSSNTPYVLVGVIAALIIIVALVISLMLYTPCSKHHVHVCREKCRDYLGCMYASINSPDGNREENKQAELITSNSWITLESGRPNIKLEEFSDHVQELHADGDYGFTKEFENIQNMVNELGLSNAISALPENKSLNRYANILAYDHTRVIISCKGDSSRSKKEEEKYINANYIDSFRKKKAYIGTQGPVAESFETFWLMIWQECVAVIVMITNFVERGRKKCDVYWPENGKEQYGIIEVELISEDIRAASIIRKLKVRNIEVKKGKHKISERTVTQYQYTIWPDHGVPSSFKALLNFISITVSANPPDAGPIVIHCSAGVGRTGTYIVLHSMLLQMEATNELNIYNFLCHIRKQRNFLVQTEEQYIFIHDALVELIKVGNTNICETEWSDYVDKLQTTSNSSDETVPLKCQLNLIKTLPKEGFLALAAHQPCNKLKNRTMDILPVEHSRVHLTHVAGKDGSDYINASYLQGFRKQNEYIITQHPLSTTIVDFWNMIWELHVKIIVLLSPSGKQYVGTYFQDFTTFWPTTSSIDAETFQVKLHSQKVHEGFPMLSIVLKSLNDECVTPLKLIQSHSWPPTESPAEALKLVKAIYNLQKRENTSVVVVDRFGGTEAASLCLLLTLLHHIDDNGFGDVFMYAQMYHGSRPGIWESEEDYLFLYKVIEEYISQKLSSNDAHALDDTFRNSPSEDSPVLEILPTQDEFSAITDLPETECISLSSKTSPSESHLVDIHFSVECEGSDGLLSEDDHLCTEEPACSSNMPCMKRISSCDSSQNLLKNRKRIKETIQIDLDAIEELSSSNESEA